MKQVMPSNGALNARPETVLSLQRRLAFLYQMERRLKEQSAVLDAHKMGCSRVGGSSDFANDLACASHFLAANDL